MSWLRSSRLGRRRPAGRPANAPGWDRRLRPSADHRSGPAPARQAPARRGPIRRTPTGRWLRSSPSADRRRRPVRSRPAPSLSVGGDPARRPHRGGEPTARSLLPKREGGAPSEPRACREGGPPGEPMPGARSAPRPSHDLAPGRAARPAPRPPTDPHSGTGPHRSPARHRPPVRRHSYAGRRAVSPGRERLRTGRGPATPRPPRPSPGRRRNPAGACAAPRRSGTAPGCTSPGASAATPP